MLFSSLQVVISCYRQSKHRVLSAYPTGRHQPKDTIIFILFLFIETTIQKKLFQVNPKNNLFSKYLSLTYKTACKQTG